jgi:hypothetical protein
LPSTSVMEVASLAKPQSSNSSKLESEAIRRSPTVMLPGGACGNNVETVLSVLRGRLGWKASLRASVFRTGYAGWDDGGDAVEVVSL